MNVRNYGKKLKFNITIKKYNIVYSLSVMVLQFKWNQAEILQKYMQINILKVKKIPI